MFYIYQTILWLILLLFISSKIKKKNRRIIFSLVSSFISTLEIVALYMTNSFIDYRFYNHMNLNAIEGHGFQFVSQFIFFIGLFLLLSLIFYSLSKKMSNYMFSHNKVFIPIILILFIMLSLPKGILNEVYKIYEILNTEEKTFNQALKDVGIPPKKYITPKQLTATKGKNIIVISIESLEQGFLGKNFNNITPHLTKLTQEWTYYDQMPVGPGGGWTSASLYNHQVGMPAFFRGPSNSFFYKTTSVKLTGLGHILNKAGYNSKYILGNAEYAGMSDLLTAYGIPTISQKNSIGKYPKVNAGLNDHSLFQEAKLQINEFKKDTDKPFALFLSTINTHFPNGIYDKTMEKIIPKRDNNIEFSASGVDYLINDLIIYLKKNKLFKNTAIYIFPDHTLMGSTGEVHQKLAKSKRQLYLLTNIEEARFPKITSDILHQIDLPKMIISGAGIKTNAKFLVDFINSKDTLGFLEDRRKELTTLNSASVNKINYKDGFLIKKINDKLILQKDDVQKELKIPQHNKILNISFNQNMVIQQISSKNIKNAFTLTGKDKKFRYLHLLVSFKQNEIDKIYFGNKKHIGMYKEDSKITHNDIAMVLNANRTNIDDVFLMNQVNKYANLYRGNKERFIAQGAGQIDEYRNTNSLEALNENYNKGFRKFELNIIKTSDDVYVAAVDWEHWANITGFRGTLPPSNSEFKKQKIYKMYTPINIDDINQWFKNHNDATLITKNTNDVISFTNTFIDSKRLIMHLNTMDALNDSLHVNLKGIMLNLSLLNNVNNKLAFLKKYKITEVAANARILDRNKALIRQLVNNGIHVYAYHLYGGVDRGPNYIICSQEQKLFYGLYVQNWDFDKILDCEKEAKDLDLILPDFTSKEIVHYDDLIVSLTNSYTKTSRKVQGSIKVGTSILNVKRGLNLVTIDHNGNPKVENYDIWKYAKSANSFLKKIESLIENKKFWAVSVHDAINTDYPGFKEKLNALNFKVLQTLKGRVAYIAYSTYNNEIKEFTSKTTLSTIIPGYVKALTKKEHQEIKKLKELKIQNNIEANIYAKEKERFIAHAGGQIDGYNYTNSLEALNLSYKKGFRLFEVDIIKTSDKIYVAAHDWKGWARTTKYKGQLPPDRETFKKYKIHNKYTAMDINDINDWFEGHPDAIMVTDKVNTPIDFSNHFIDKQRLIMELFSLDAVEKGIKAGIKSAMPTYSVLKKLKGDKVAYLKELGITDIAASRRTINSQKDLLLEIGKAGINIYAFHLHYNKGMDEKHVVCKERKYFYGMYADNWDFNTILDCDE